MLSLLTASMDPGQGLPQPTKGGACTGAHLCKSRLPQLGNHWNLKKKTQLGARRQNVPDTYWPDPIIFISKLRAEVKTSWAPGISAHFRKQLGLRARKASCTVQLRCERLRLAPPRWSCYGDWHLERWHQLKTYENKDSYGNRFSRSTASIFQIVCWKSSFKLWNRSIIQTYSNHHHPCHNWRAGES